MRTTKIQRSAAIITFVAAGSLSMAQSYSSFNSADGIFGVSVTQNGLMDTVSIANNAYLMIGATRYDITNDFGFWSLSATNPLNASGVDQNSWNWNAKSVGGDIAGWTNNSKSNDILPGGQASFTYSAINQSNVEEYGFHFSLAQSFNGSNTAFFKGPLEPVPEPASLACLGLGITALVRLRRRRA